MMTAPRPSGGPTPWSSWPGGRWTGPSCRPPPATGVHRRPPPPALDRRRRHRPGQPGADLPAPSPAGARRLGADPPPGRNLERDAAVGGASEPHRSRRRAEPRPVMGDPGAQHADSSHDLRPPPAQHRPGVAAHDPRQPVALLGTDLLHLHLIGRRLPGESPKKRTRLRSPQAKVPDLDRRAGQRAKVAGSGTTSRRIAACRCCGRGGCTLVSAGALPRAEWPKCSEIASLCTARGICGFAAAKKEGWWSSVSALGRRLSAEFVGTFWLVLGGCGSAVLAAKFPDVGIGLLGVALAFGLTVLT